MDPVYIRECLAARRVHPFVEPLDRGTCPASPLAGFVKTIPPVLAIAPAPDANIQRMNAALDCCDKKPVALGEYVPEAYTLQFTEWVASRGSRPSRCRFCPASDKAGHAVPP